MMSGKLCAVCLEKYVYQTAIRRSGGNALRCDYMPILCEYTRQTTSSPLLCFAILHIIINTDMTKDSRQRTRRRQALSTQGASHPHPETVTDSLFRDSAFFDPNDLVQVKYEMLRSVQKEGRAVVEAAQAFGLSRPVFYVTQAVFQREGLPGLLPRKRGPKRPHKLNDEAMTILLEAIKAAERMPKGEELATLLAQRCGVNMHPRSILRRLRPYVRQEEKKRR
jgi:transposase